MIVDLMGGVEVSHRDQLDEESPQKRLELEPHLRHALRPEQEEFFIDNLLVRIRLIIEMILVDRPCAMGV